MTDHLTQSSFNSLNNSISKPSFHDEFDKAKKKDKVIIAVTSKKSSVRKHSSTRESGVVVAGGGDKIKLSSINNVKPVEKTTTTTTLDTSTNKVEKKANTAKRRNKKKALGFEIDQPIIEEERDEEDDYIQTPQTEIVKEDETNEESKSLTIEKEEVNSKPEIKIKSKASRIKTDEDKRKQRRNSRSNNNNEETNSTSSLNNSGSVDTDREEETENAKVSKKSMRAVKAKKNHVKKSKQAKKKEEVVNDEAEYYDLYNTEPDIIYLKQKYHMYLDWLSHNHLQKTNLNWYQYEISLNYRENNNLKKCLDNFFTTSKSDTSPVRVMNKPVGASRLPNLAYNNNLATTYLPKISNKQAKQTSLSQSSPNFAINHSRLSDSFATQRSVDSTVTLPPLINNNKKLFRGVKFDSGSSYLDPRFVSNSSGYFNYAASTTGSTTSSSMLKKPILKQHNGETSHELRRASIHSLTTSSSNDKHSDQNSEMMSMKMSMSSSSNKLPPIARCSDDFYAVLNDLENFI